ncbi:hypothetical protein O181_006865 [Austropuccinia psidii MF-1]|uniref:Chromo domain-containing protein n=1 Tax=Austropuccinia psidii MF-1 TaxID=1389203 RepID=A0A9Q3BL92_9BASI|nr:hypothetical protein [Austropuccinia psidii MF-1]
MGNNAVEVKISEEFSRKHPVMPDSLVNPYHQTDEEKFSKRKEAPSSEKLIEQDSLGPVKRILRSVKIEINGKDHRQYLVRFKSQAEDRDKWFPEQDIPDR